jgi:hypothetical protein
MTNDELLVWRELSAALNLDAQSPVSEQTEEERAAAYWDKVFASLMYSERSATRDACVYAERV